MFKPFILNPIFALQLREFSCLTREMRFLCNFLYAAKLSYSGSKWRRQNNNLVVMLLNPYKINFGDGLKH